MNNLTRTPIVDSTGKATHVWKGDGVQHTGSSRLGSLAAPVAPSSQGSFDWSSLSYEDRVDYVFDYLGDMFEEHKLDYRVKLHDSYDIFGQTTTTNGTEGNTISISKQAIQYASQEEITEIMTHEVAHAKVPHHGHDNLWKRVAARIGANPSHTTHIKDMPPPPGGKEKAFIEKKDEQGNAYQYEVPVYVGDTVRAWDGKNVTITKINRKNMIARNDKGEGYNIRITSADQYRKDYESWLSATGQA